VVDLHGVARWLEVDIWMNSDRSNICSSMQDKRRSKEGVLQL
jgi:hypothetical protein